MATQIPTTIPARANHFLLKEKYALAIGYRDIATNACSMESFGLKKLCPNNLGCKRYNKVAISAFRLELKMSLENKKKPTIPIK